MFDGVQQFLGSVCGMRKLLQVFQSFGTIERECSLRDLVSANASLRAVMQ